MSKKRKAPITVQLIGVMILIMLVIVAISWILNHMFLEKYYLYQKQQEIIDCYTTLSVASSEGTLTDDEFDVTFESMCDTGNIMILVLDTKGFIVRSSSANDQMFQVQLNGVIMGNQQMTHSNVIEVCDSYILESTNDSRMNAEYLTLWGNLEDGSYVYIRTALESIRESAEITSRFLLFIELGAFLIGVILILLVARGLTGPIRELSGISKRMSGLDFNAKYVRKRGSSREIDELGEHMNELSQTLEQTIAELKTANVQLQQDIAKKEEIDDMRKEFISNVSHELKTPLALIQGYSEGLKECINEDQESRDFYCDVIIDETDKMNRMVKKLLTLNQLEFGNETVEMKRFDMTELIRGLVNATSLMAAQKEITISMDNTEPAYVWGDEFKVEEVITNFLSNAMNHAAGEKQIHIFYTRIENRLRVSVFNTGERIPEEELDKVWIKFYKVDKARTREYGGNGIGLSIVKAIMDSFHQECGAINHEDGVEFWMELEMDGGSPE